LFSLIQDVVALKVYLTKMGKWYPNVYERLRGEVIEGDAYSGGDDGILHHSYIQYFWTPTTCCATHSKRAMFEEHVHLRQATPAISAFQAGLE